MRRVPWTGLDALVEPSGKLPRCCSLCLGNNVLTDVSSGTHHSSPPGGDQRQHVTVRPDKGKTFHAYDDGTASKKGKKGKTITFRDLDLDYEY